MRPKVLIVSRKVWDDNRGTSSTLSNLFANYGADRIAMIYTETVAPCTKCCNLFFQISEYSLIKRLIKWRTKTGLIVNSQSETKVIDEEASNKEQHILAMVKKHRSPILSWMRDVLWSFGGWKSDELRRFIKDFDPDVVWLDGNTNVYLNRLYEHVVKVAQKPAVFYFMDDNYTYKSVENGYCFARMRVRRSVDSLMKHVNKVFVISPKMKEEYDRLFNTDSTIVTKSIDYSSLNYSSPSIHKPIRIVYLGQILYGRLYTLLKVIECLDEINCEEPKTHLSIYTTNYISPKEKQIIERSQSAELCDPVPYQKVPDIIKENDVLLFMESLDKRYNKGARLSFSTKITDYLSSSKCIFAVGPEDCAPMEYFKKEDCAITAIGEDDIKPKIQQLLDESVITNYSRAAFETGKRNHEQTMMEERVKTELINLSKMTYKK